MLKSKRENILRDNVSAARDYLQPRFFASVETLNARDMEDITRWREDMNFMFECKNIRSLVRYCSCLENIKFISLSQRVMFFLLYGETNSTNAKGENRDVIERYDTHKGDIRKIRHSGPG